MNIWFSSRPRQHTNASGAPGTSARRMLANAATGSSKNITPNRDTAASNGPRPARSSVWASATTNLAPGTRSRRGRDHRRRDVHADAGRAAGRRPLQQGAGAAADVEHPHPVVRRDRRVERLGEPDQLGVVDPPVLDPGLGALRPEVAHVLVRHGATVRRRGLSVRAVPATSGPTWSRTHLDPRELGWYTKDRADGARAARPGHAILVP